MYAQTIARAKYKKNCSCKWNHHSVHESNLSRCTPKSVILSFHKAESSGVLSDMSCLLHTNDTIAGSQVSDNPVPENHGSQKLKNAVHLPWFQPNFTLLLKTFSKVQKVV